MRNDWARGSTRSLPWPGWWAGGGRRWSRRTRPWAARSGPAGFHSSLPSSLQHYNETTHSLLAPVQIQRGRLMSWKVTHRLSFVTSPCTLDQVGQRVGGEREEASVLQTGPHLKITTFDATEVTLKPKCVGCGFSGSHLARHSSSQHREAVHTRGNHIHRWVNNRR